MSELKKGWDAVLGLSFSLVNETFYDAQSTDLIPRTGRRTYAFATGTSQTDVHVSATVGAWRVVEASGNKVAIRLILASGFLNYDDLEVDLSRLDFRVTVPLKCEELISPEERNYILTLDFADKETIAVPNMTIIASQVPRSDLIGLNAVLTDFFFDALSGGAVDLVCLDANLFSENRKWLSPKSVACAGYTESAGSGALGLMLATVNTPPRDAMPTLSAQALPADGETGLSFSNEILTKYFAAPAFAKTLGIPLNTLSIKPGRPWAVELAGPTDVKGATLSRARMSVSKGALHLTLIGTCKSWGGATVSFEISAAYDVAIGGNGPVPKLAFRRVSRSETHKLQIPAAAKAVTLGATGMHSSRAEELLQTIVEAVAPQRLGSPLLLSFVTGIKWPFGRNIVPKSVNLTSSLQMSFGPV